MATILFVMFPEMGHTNASFKIAKDLKARKHDVWYLAIPDFEQHIRSQGLEVRRLFANLYPDGFAQALASQGPNLETAEAIQTLLEAKLGGKRNAMDVIQEEIEGSLENIRPDAVIIDTLLPEVALMCGDACATVFMSTNFDNHIDESGHFAYKYVRHIPELILCPEEFDLPRPRDFNRRYYYVEASVDVGRVEQPFPWRLLDSEKDLIYCSLGSQARLHEGSGRLLQTIVDAMAARPRLQMVLATGKHLGGDRFHDVPPNVVMIDVAPQMEILKAASLMIGHGGLNSVKEAIYFGVPLISFPLLRDQPMNAARIERHRLGLRGDIRNASVESVGQLIDAVMQDKSYRLRAESMSRRFRASEASCIGAGLIESLLNERRPALAEHALVS